jgi:hypothetical protein
MPAASGRTLIRIGPGCRSTIEEKDANVPIDHSVEQPAGSYANVERIEFGILMSGRSKGLEVAATRWAERTPGKSRGRGTRTVTGR